MTARRTAPLVFAALVALAVPGTSVVGSAPTDLREVRVFAEGEETVVRLQVGDAERVRDFLLEDPVRLMVDLEGVRHALPGHNFPVGRGGVTRVRSSQFRDGVVRVVISLTERADYRLEREDGTVTIRFRNPGGSFAAWSTADDGAAAVGSAGREDATPEAGTDGRTRPDGVRPAARPVDQEAEQPRVTVTYDEASMQDVLAGFAEFAGVSIVPSSEAVGMSVQGVSIRDKPWDQALNAILSAYGLGWRRLEGGIIMVDELSALRGRDTLQTETRVFRINYAGADSVANMLQQLATPDRGQVVAYEGTNSVIATDVPSVVSRMDSLISVLDRRTPQVSIEARIIFVDRTDVDELGIVYDLKDQSALTGFQQVTPTEGVEPGQQQPGGQQGQQRSPFTVDLGGPAVAALANANDRVASPALQILANTVFGGFSLTTFVDALRSHQLSDIQASPSIQVVDNHAARIQVGERTPIRVLEPQAQLQQAQVNVQFEETGVILEVTPHVTNNNQVLLDLHAERSGIAVGPSDLGFVFDTQEGTTRLLLDDGETGVIAGLTLSEMTRSETGIPLLMDLPFLGSLFRTTRQNEQKQDLIILVTPRVVRSSGASVSPFSN